jgi:hypothetical protein
MTQRARFVFQAPPKNLAQLEHLIVVDRNITYADGTRQLPRPAEGAKVAGRGVAVNNHHAVLVLPSINFRHQVTDLLVIIVGRLATFREIVLHIWPTVEGRGMILGLGHD